MIEPLEPRALFHAAVPIYIDAGGGPYTDPSTNVTYAKDYGFSGGASGTQSFAVDNTSRDALYVTRRWGANFGYHLPVANGEYQLKLLFVEPAWNGAGQRKFDVYTEKKQVLNDFDIYAAAGFRTATTRTFDVTVNDGALNVWFTGVVDNAIVSGIEITPVHDDAQPPPVDNGTIKWTSAAANPQARFEGQGAVVNGKFYVFGGYYNAAVQATKRSDVYDPATNKWTRIRDMPEAITHAGVAVDGNTVYIIGGYNGNHPSPGTNQVWKYNTSTNTWSAGPNLPEARGSGAAARSGRFIHFFAGTNGNRTSDKKDHWALNLDTGAWSSRASYPISVSHLAAVELGGKIYGMGGERGLNESTGNVSDVYRYDPATNRWTKLASLPVARSHFSSSLFARNGRLIAIGGTGNGGANGTPRNDVTEYNPLTNRWRTLTSLPMALKTPAAALLNGKIISTTGNASGGAVPVANTWIGTVS
ncbi:MAG: malectin domain-containing carbohydrate-binding protein [Planctomycetota bacterium]|nr:malectin domain-containing carbohydrate-binding protein [Planctomycetota bacterium]